MVDKQDDQIKKFKKVARELGCDEDEAAFEDRLRRIVLCCFSPSSVRSGTTRSTGAATAGDDERRRARQSAGVFLRSYGTRTKASYRDVHVKHYCSVPKLRFLGSGELLSFVSHR